MPTPIRFVAVTSTENSEVIHDLLYRKFFWQTENESAYLVPTTQRYKPVRSLLRRVMRLRAKGMDINTANVKQMRSFLEGRFEEECHIVAATVGDGGRDGDAFNSAGLSNMEEIHNEGDDEISLIGSTLISDAMVSQSDSS